MIFSMRASFVLECAFALGAGVFRVGVGLRNEDVSDGPTNQSGAMASGTSWVTR